MPDRVDFNYGGSYSYPGLWSIHAPPNNEGSDLTDTYPFGKFDDLILKGTFEMNGCPDPDDTATIGMAGGGGVASLTVKNGVGPKYISVMDIPNPNPNLTLTVTLTLTLTLTR